jgi:8-oxo-dGTP diphosphatase
MNVGRFLAGIAALIWDPEQDRYLLLRRAAGKDFGAGGWECPTGRLDQGEGFTAALHREVREELGVEIVLEFPIGATHFYRGTAIPENELVGLVFCCRIQPGQTLTVSAEHDAWEWIAADTVSSFLPAGHWLLPVIARARFLQENLPTAVRLLYQAKGFDL